MSENVFDKALISDEEWSKVLISRLSSRPNAKTAYGSGGYDAKAMKAAFDAQGNLLKERHNTLVDYARAAEGARAQAESERITEESKRRAAETTRGANEDERVTAEEQRQINEFGAVGNYYEEEANAVHNSLGEVIPNAEGGRVGAEIQRRHDEAERVKNEISRKARFSEMVQALGDLDSALDELHGYAQALIGGGAV